MGEKHHKGKERTDGQLMWYRQPASVWEEALPVGCGRLGAMIYGNPDHEIMQLNEDSIWYGGPIDRINPDARSHMDEARRLILEGNIAEAEEILKYNFCASPRSMRLYQPLGWLHLDMRTKGVLPSDRFKADTYSKVADFPRKTEEPILDYRRELSLEEGVHRVSFTQCGTAYQRETFASFPAQIIAVHMTAGKKGALSFSCLLERGRFLEWSGKAGGDTVMIRGSMGDGGVRYCGAVSVSAEGGSIRTAGEHILVDNADSATIYIAAGSTYYYGEEYVEKTLDYLAAARKKGYMELRKEHTEDYQNLYGRMSLRLSGQEGKAAENESLSTDVRLERVKNLQKDNGLVETYFNFGRYLLISSSRPGSLPANLQGVWNDKMEPKWDSKYTININAQMNYWPAETCGLQECHLPLFSLIRTMQKSGHEVAERMYGCRGFVAHHNTDLWGDCAPQDSWPSATYWVMGGAWLCLHIWKHYEYTLDREWLASVYDLIRESVLFFEDFLIEKDGEVLICPSTSPENTYLMEDWTEGRVTAGSTMDNTILKELLEDFLKISEVLGICDEVAEKAKEILPKIHGLQIGKHGQIMEWREDYDEIEPGHRHISQLFALYPGREISPDKTPEFARAAEVTLKRRLENGGGHTGWSCAWIIAYYARLHQGNLAMKYLTHLLKYSTCTSLLDTHPLNPSGVIFQIDGNLGATAAIIEMIVQTSDEEIYLLPALPDEWPDGKAEGICLPGAVTLSVTWKEKKTVSAEFAAKVDVHRRIRADGQLWSVDLKAGEKLTLDLCRKEP